jgi:MFS family permease
MYVWAHHVRWLYLATPIFGLAIGAGMTAAYTAAAQVIPPAVRGVGFGLLTTASLIGMAVSPVVCGFLGATSIRTVFVFDLVGLAALAAIVQWFARGGRPRPEQVGLPREPMSEHV